jgi:hypothetical protein
MAKDWPQQSLLLYLSSSRPVAQAHQIRPLLQTRIKPKRPRLRHSVTRTIPAAYRLRAMLIVQAEAVMDPSM